MALVNKLIDFVIVSYVLQVDEEPLIRVFILGLDLPLFYEWQLLGLK